MMQQEEVKKKLCSKVRKGNWNEVVKIYEECSEQPEVRRTKISQSGGTALHMAVYEGKEKIVRQLVDLMEMSDLKDLADDRGNTPLHLAAKMGNNTMCQCIASKKSGLISDRNKEGETPMFLAALHGKKDTFLILCFFFYFEENIYSWDDPKIYLHGRRTKDGCTILHCAIDGEYFELAYQIINRFPAFLQYVDERGYSPLHLLASKNSSFRSSTRLTWLQQLIYPCIPAKKPRVTEDHHQGEGDEDPHSNSKPAKKPSVTEDHQGDKDPRSNSKPAKKPSVTEDHQEDGDPHSNSKNGNDEENPPRNGQLNKNNNPQSIYSKARQFIRRLYFCIYFKIRWFIRRLRRLFLIAVVLPKHGLLRMFPKHIVEMKEKHLWAIDIKEILLQNASDYDYLDNGSQPQPGPESFYNQILEESHLESNHDNQTHDRDTPRPLSSFTVSFSHTKQGIDHVTKLLNTITDSLVSLENGSSQKPKRLQETPILIAAKNGIKEIVEDILKEFPVAVHDVNSEGKNLMLMAVENRQPQVCQLLTERKITKSIDDLFLGLDNEGNSALHLAAILNTYQPWLAPNAVLQMQWEIKWYEWIKESVPRHLWGHQNKEGKTAEDIFMETHTELVKNDTEWLMKTSDSCTIVAALIATVAFATSASVPGGNQENGEPVLKRQRMFEVFSISSLGALCFSLTAVVMFLAILTSRHQATDFGSFLPTKLLIGLTALFLSIASVLVSFCGGHFFILKDVLKDARVAEYVVAVIPVAVFAIAQCPLYFKLILATIKKVPDRGFMVTTGGNRGGDRQGSRHPQT